MAGSQALEKFANVKPDLVILDIMMPGLDGFEVCELGYRLGDSLSQRVRPRNWEAAHSSGAFVL